MVTDEAFAKDFWLHHPPCAASYHLFYGLLDKKRKEDEMNRLTPDQAAAVRIAEKFAHETQAEVTAEQADLKLRAWCIETALKANDSSSRDIAITACNIYKFMKGATETEGDT